MSPTDGATRLESGPHSAVWRLEGPHDVVVKLAPARSVEREAAALAAVASLGIAPRVVAVGAGAIVLEALPGAAVALDAERARVLGPVLRRLHDSRVSGHGAWPDWDAPETAVGAYHARSVTSALAWAGERTDVATAIAVRLPVPGPGDGPPFRRLHGDLWGGNLLWDAGAVRLVDWEYCRQGDPAEELAYLLEMDSVGEEVAEALLTAYGGPIAERVRAWRPLAALMAGLWFHDAGMDERGATLVERAAALCAAP